MADISFETLAQALRDAAAAAGKVTLNAAFLNDNGAPVGEEFDALLKSSYGLPEEAAGLEVHLSPGDVGAPSDTRLEVTGARISFLDLPLDKSDVLLRFGVAAGDEGLATVRIGTGLTGWVFADSFPFMTGWPFDVLDFAGLQFVFASQAGTWKRPNGDEAPVVRGQNLVATLPVPDAFQPIFQSVPGLEVPPTVMIVGSIALDKVNNETVLYPDMALRGSLQKGQISVFLFTVQDPYIGFRIASATEEPDPEEAARRAALGLDDAPKVVQTPELYFGSAFRFETGIDDQSVTMQLTASVQRAQAAVSFLCQADPDAGPTLSPAAAVALAGGDISYFARLPAPLQQFMTRVGLESLGFSGRWASEPTQTQLTLRLASVPETNWVLMEDPTTDQLFDLKQFAFDWTLINPQDAARRKVLAQFSTAFVLWPDVFKGKQPDEDGLFTIAFNQDLHIDGGFDGQVSLNDLLLGVTLGAIGLPNGVSMALSEITLAVDPKDGRYSLGFTADIAVDFVTLGDKPLLQVEGMRFDLTALVPTKDSDQTQRDWAGFGGAMLAAEARKTAYKGSMAGGLAIGEIAANVDIRYDGTADPKHWTLHADLAQPVTLLQVLDQFFYTDALPDFLKPDIALTKLEVDADLPSAAPAAGGAPPVLADDRPQATYDVAAALTWRLELGHVTQTIATEFGLQYDGAREAGERLSGSVVGTFTLDPVGFEMQAGYAFGPADPAERARMVRALSAPGGTDALTAAATNQTLWVAWNGIRATYDFQQQTVTFRLSDWTVGAIIEQMVQALGDPYFTLPEPWSLLNQISLNGLELVIDLSGGGAPSVYGAYRLPSPLNLGFVTVNGLEVRRLQGPDASQPGKVTLVIDGETNIGALKDSDLFNPHSDGQDVQEMPDVPGRGSSLFKLQLLALGQHVAIAGAPEFENVAEVIAALKAIPGSDGPENPVDPTSTVPGQPYYDPNSNWLAALHFGVLYVGKDPAFDMMVVFNDPALYGLRLAFANKKAKVLEGLKIDILYKKVTDEVGLYQIEFSFPGVLRNLDFGAFAITLPDLGIKIYTNGDFLIDVGFPYNQDFSRSFTVQAIVYGVPVLGSGGFYFGKLSPATATQTPPTPYGTFDPVLLFGLGAQLGLGRTIDKGILKAGFSITIFGIVEGVIAPWHPYEPAHAGSGGLVQGDYYFWLQGTFGVIGKLYGTVDFAIVKASVELTVTVYARITYESFRAIPLGVYAGVSVKVSVKIGWGIFSISISFKFAASIEVNLTIGSNQTAPWDAGYALDRAYRRRLDRLAGCVAPLSVGPLVFKPLVRAAADDKPTLTLVPTPQFTVTGPAAGDLADQRGAFVFLLSISAPVAGDPDPADGTDFETLCAALFSWVIDAVQVPDRDLLSLAEAGGRPVGLAELEALLKLLSDSATPPIDADDILAFLHSAFTIDVVSGVGAAAEAVRATLAAGATMFPAFTGLSLTVPDPDGGDGQKTVPFDDAARISGDYRRDIAALFATLAARLEDEQRSNAAVRAWREDDRVSVARFVFEDYFLLVARQLVQTAIDALHDFVWPLTAEDSLGTVLAWFVAAGNDHMDLSDIAAPNLDHPLAGGKALLLDGLAYAVQAGDSFAAIAGHYTDPAAPPRWALTADALALANGAATDILRAGATVTLTGAGGESRTVLAGQSLADLAAAFGLGSVEQLLDRSDIATQSDLLRPAAPLAIPPLAYRTAEAGEDTLESVLGRFDLPLEAFLAVPENAACIGLFDPGARDTLQVAHVDTLTVETLWQGIRRRDAVAQTAAMAARYQLQGMRLPALAGLDLGDPFLYPRDEDSYGLYQLTGQQVPTPAFGAVPAYGMALHKDATLDWLRFDGAAGRDTLELGLDEAARLLSVTLDYARTKGYRPDPALLPQPLARVEAKRYGVAEMTRWASSDQAGIAAVTAPPGDGGQAVRDSAETPQVRPLLWTLPGALTLDLEARQQALAGRYGLDRQLSYMPVLQPMAGTTDPASRRTGYAPCRAFSFASRLDQRIRRLAQAEDMAPQRPGANDVLPPGPGNSGAPGGPLAPHSYELVPPSAADTLLLQRLLTAVGTLGEQLLSGLFLLMPDRGTGAQGLVSRGAAEYVAFLTQTNLSTETAPPTRLSLAVDAAEGEAPRGLLNSPAEFLKLFWELGTVQSNGTYLFYQFLDGAPLPSALFDETGVATLTLVVTYPRALLTEPVPQSGGRLANFVNAVVTADALDPQRAVLSLEAVSAPAGAPAMAEGESLADLAALYGVGVGTLAAANAEVPLRLGADLPVVGGLHQIDQADMAGGDPLGAVAAWLSRGAVTPVTAQDLAGYNPGLSIGLGAVLRLPPVVYRVAESGDGPGTTLAAMAAYYRQSLDALAAAAAAVVGLFRPGAALSVDPMNREVSANLGTGNIGLTLTRADLGEPQDLPPDPTDAEKEAFARAMLFQLYGLLSSGLAPNPFFKASPQGVPFGPTEELDRAGLEALRRPHSRRALLGSVGDGVLRFRTSLGFGDYTTVNPAPEPDGDALPPAAANPYAGVGGLAQTRLRWLDLFGNRTVTPFDRVPVGYTGPLNDLPVAIAYVDRPIALNRWPGVRSWYRYTGDAGSPALELTLAFDSDAYDPPEGADDPRAIEVMPGRQRYRQMAEDDAKRLRQLYFQLHQDYSDLGIPGLSGQAIALSLTNSLLADPAVPLAPADQDRIRAFVADCLRHVETRSQGGAAADVPCLVLSLPVALQAIAAADIVELELSLVLTRQPLLCDPALRGVADGLRAASAIAPLTDDRPLDDQARLLRRSLKDDGPPVTLSHFARLFEAAFVTDGWQMRIGTGTATPEAAAGPGGLSVWAVRMARTPGQGLGYAIDPHPGFYAPLPLAQQLRSGVVEIGRYVSGQPFPDGDPVSISFTGVDLNVWMADMLAAVETFLSPGFVNPAYLVDRLTKGDGDALPGGEAPGDLAAILRCKERLATAIADTVRPILSDSPDDADSLAAAAEKLRQALLVDLAAGFAVDAVTVFTVRDAAWRQGLAPGVVVAPRFYGQPTGSLPKGDGGGRNRDFTLSSAKIPLVASDDPTAESRLAFLFTSTCAQAQSSVALDLAYALSYLEHDIRTVPGIENYQQSLWIGFVTGPESTPIGEGPIELPVVLRALPTPPTITGQTAEGILSPEGQALATVASALAPGDLASWTYGFAWHYDQAAQDAVTARIELNLTLTPTRGDATPEAALFQALAQFVTVQPAVAADLAASLPQVDGKSRRDDAPVHQAAAAMAAFRTLVEEATAAYEAWVQAQRTVSLLASPLHSVLVFDIRLAKTDDGRARIDLLKNDADSHNSAGLPAPVVWIAADHYQPEAVEGPPGTLASYLYRLRDSDEPVWLSYADALADPERRVTLAPLDVFAHQNGWASIQVVRNKYILGDGERAETVDAFRFRTPEVKFADPAVPLLSYGQVDLVGAAGPARPLADWLDGFFADLFANSTGETVQVSLEGAYAYPLSVRAAGLPATVLPITLMLPAAAAASPSPPPGFVGAFADAVTGWLAAETPADVGGADLRFALLVYGGAGSDAARAVLGAADTDEQRPLLTVRALTLPAGRVQRP